jgi:exonuclease SbcD
MKILHTSDWHLGKKLEGRDRLEEQRKVLAEINGIIKKEKIGLVLVGGDIFDVFTPSAEAEDLFYETLNLFASNDAAVIAIAGNHDDPKRVCAAKSLAEKQGIYIVGDASDMPAPNPSIHKKIKVIESGEGFLKLENKETKEKVCLAILPFPSDSRNSEAINEGETYNEKVNRWIARGAEKFANDSINIVLSHLFALGGEGCLEERNIELGGTRAISFDTLPKNTHYGALGHLHRAQKVKHDIPICYSGSILQYSFDDNKQSKSVIVLDAGASGITNFKTVNLTQGRKLLKVSASSVEKAYELLDKLKNDFAELTLHLDKPLTPAENKNLRVKYPLLVTINLKLKELDEQPVSLENRRKLNRQDLFIDFFKSTQGHEPGKEVVELFLELAE